MFKLEWWGADNVDLQTKPDGSLFEIVQKLNFW